MLRGIWGFGLYKLGEKGGKMPKRRQIHKKHQRITLLEPTAVTTDQKVPVTTIKYSLQVVINSGITIS